MFDPPYGFRLMRRLFVFPWLLALVSCSAGKVDPVNYFKSLYWDAKLTQRETGEHMIVDPTRIWRKLRCDNRKLPYAQIDENEIIPARLAAGEKINHHFVYSLCPSQPSKVEYARFTRSILYKGSIIFQDVVNNFELKPGRWSVDAFVTVSDKAEPGVYSLQVTMNSSSLNISVNSGFVVYEAVEESKRTSTTVATNER